VSFRIRVATWNVHGLRAGVGAVADVVRTEAVDVLMLQESGPRRGLRALGAALGMLVCADPPAFPRRRVQNAVLIRNPHVVGHSFLRFSHGSFLYPRGALIAQIDEGLSVVSVHLGLSGSDRGRHIQQLVGVAGGSSKRFVIGGDLNALPTDPGPRMLAARATDCWHAVGHGEGHTFPSHAPAARIDYLFAGPAIQPLRAWTAGGTVSDHLMVVADLRMDDDS
jgi:endonuclease/exonuclease/phosphatase family metal-dependent hydrolase